MTKKIMIDSDKYYAAFQISYYNNYVATPENIYSISRNQNSKKYA